MKSNKGLYFQAILQESSKSMGNEQWATHGSQIGAWGLGGTWDTFLPFWEVISLIQTQANTEISIGASWEQLWSIFFSFFTTILYSLLWPSSWCTSWLLGDSSCGCFSTEIQIFSNCCLLLPRDTWILGLCQELFCCPGESWAEFHTCLHYFWANSYWLEIDSTSCSLYVTRRLHLCQFPIDFFPDFSLGSIPSGCSHILYVIMGFWLDYSRPDSLPGDGWHSLWWFWLTQDYCDLFLWDSNSDSCCDGGGGYFGSSQTKEHQKAKEAQNAKSNLFHIVRRQSP